MQTLNAPIVGKVYQSQAEPTLKVLVESVETFQDEGETFFHVEACDPSDKDDMGGIGYDYTSDEWIDMRFALVV